jgi:D-lactate dehydrogenase
VYENERALFFADRSDEPLADDTFAVLSHMPQVQMTAHCAFFAREAIVEIAAACLENAASYRDKKPSKNDVK